MEALTTEQVSRINKKAIADKFNCHGSYVTKVLTGERNDNTELAKKIRLMGRQLIEVLEA